MFEGILGGGVDYSDMNENTPPEGDTTETEVPTQPVEAPPKWATDKFRRNTVIGGAAVAGAVFALAGAALVGDHDRHGRGDLRAGGPPGMQGGHMQGGPGMRGGQGMQQGGPGMQGGQGMQGERGFEQRGPGAQDQQDDEGPTGRTN